MTIKQTQPSVKQQVQMGLMIGKQMASSYPGWTIIISAVVGLIVGLIFAWMIWPVTWTETRPSRLSDQYKAVYLNFAATTHATGGMSTEQVAQQLGEGWSKDDVLRILDGMIKDNYAGNQGALQKLRDDLSGTDVTIGPKAVPAAPSSLLLLLLIVLAIIALLILLYMLVRRVLQKPSQPTQVATAIPTPGAVGEAAPVIEAAPVVVPPVSRAVGGARPVEKTAWLGEARTPLTQFATTYAIGDDRYDMSNSIETPAGDFLGECGVGISETLGTGSPDKVTALELWLFDKNDVRTLTKVLMSEHAYNDGAIRAKLAPKGDAVMLRKGEIVELTTQTLKLNARVVDLTYGVGGLPPNSFFQQVTLEIATWNLAG